jgi:hypothetical protein
MAAEPLVWRGFLPNSVSDADVRDGILAKSSLQAIQAS